MRKPLLPVRASLLICSSLALAGTRAAVQVSPIDLGKARQYFAEAKALSDKDNGGLWKVALCGPLLFVDPQTRSAVTGDWKRLDARVEAAVAGGSRRPCGRFRRAQEQSIGQQLQGASPWRQFLAENPALNLHKLTRTFLPNSGNNQRAIAVCFLKKKKNESAEWPLQLQATRAASFSEHTKHPESPKSHRK
jgi:hypothetical protein